jgi:hypothetical protein
VSGSRASVPLKRDTQDCHAHELYSMLLQSLGCIRNQKAKESYAGLDETKKEQGGRQKMVLSDGPAAGTTSTQGRTTKRFRHNQLGARRSHPKMLLLPDLLKRQYQDLKIFDRLKALNRSPHDLQADRAAF